MKQWFRKANPIPERESQKALLISLLSLAVPVVSGALSPDWLSGDLELLVWILPLLPAFLLSYHHGWKGASIALSAGMAALAISQSLLALTGIGQSIPTLFILAFIAVLIVVSLGSGWVASSLRESLQHARDAALTDHVTGLPNRRAATEFLEKQFYAAKRGTRLALVMFDLDHFKAVNDTYGHATGDEVLRLFASVLRPLTREMNLSARQGGEEFLSVQTLTDAEGAAIFADKVRRAFNEAPGPAPGRTVSAGVAQYEDGMASPDVLIAAADQALYRAKQAGRNRVEVIGLKGRRPDAPRPAQQTATSMPLGNGQRILVVDDDHAARRGMARGLQRLGYSVLEAGSAAEAIQILNGIGEPIDLVVTDIVMPDVGGFRLMQMINDIQPDVRSLYVSGYNQEEVDWAGVPGAAWSFVSKPISLDELGSAVSRVLEQSPRSLSPAGAPADAPKPREPETPRAPTSEAVTLVRAAERQELASEMLRRLARAAEYRDELTADHAERVGRLAGAIAAEMGWSVERRILIEEAAILHDVGKIAVPDAILRKAGSLTPAERLVMEQHTIVGRDILSGSRIPVLALAAEIALSHHEHWDGNGYPARLAGKEIPESGRIVAAADSFDALTHMRPYRAPMSEEEAVGWLKGGSSAQFDPEVIDAFLLVRAKGGLKRALTDWGAVALPDSA